MKTPSKRLLRTQLFRWLLFPLLALLAVDAAVSYRVANEFAQRAYDRALLEIARELALLVRPDDDALKLDLPEAARQILFEDSLDTIYFELADREGRLLEGAAIAAPTSKAPAPAGNGSLTEVLYDSEIGENQVRALQSSPLKMRG